MTAGAPVFAAGAGASGTTGATTVAAATTGSTGDATDSTLGAARTTCTSVVASPDEMVPIHANVLANANPNTNDTTREVASMVCSFGVNALRFAGMNERATGRGDRAGTGVAGSGAASLANSE